MYSFKLSVGQTAFAGKDIYSNEAIASFLAEEKVNLNYLRYSSCFIIENAQVNIYNAKILNQDLINNAYVPFPPLDEQKRIAEFLDKKCGEIDEVIAKTEKTIEEYKALKQSVITEAVTKGIRPISNEQCAMCNEQCSISNVQCAMCKKSHPMKDSGIEWIGQIPEDWNKRKIKNIAQFFNGDSIGCCQPCSNRQLYEALF